MAARKPPATPAPGAQGGRQPDAFRPTSGRRRLLLAALAVVTVLVITTLMLRPHQQLVAAKAARADAARELACPSGAASATPGCPGGRMDVLVLPVVPAAPR